MTTTTPTIGQDFAARIENLGITQEFLAEYVGLSQPEISKLVSGLRPQGEGHRKINDALRDLENVADFFKPMKPLFDDPAAVKEWLRSPSLPNLFALLAPQSPESWQESVRREWLEFLEASSRGQSSAASI